MPSRSVLSVAPGVSSIGFCYFEGTELLDWGVRRAADRGTGWSGRKRVVVRLVEQYRPELVVLPSIRADDGRRPRQGKFIESVRISLVGGRADVASCGNEDVQECFRRLTGEADPTKHRIMAHLGVLFPQLSPLVPPRRRAWDPQDYWTPMFAAAAQAVAGLTQSS